MLVIYKYVDKEKVMFKKICAFVVYLCIVTQTNAESTRVYDVVIPFSAGGPSDVLFRFIEPELNTRLQHHQIKLVVKNIPGAGGGIGLSKITSSNELMFGFFSPFFAINKSMKPDSDYDYDSVNFLNFSGLNKMVIISGTHTDLKSLQDQCKKINSLSFGSSGFGSTSHLSAYYYATKYLNCKDVVSVPYKGVSMVYPDLKAGRIDFMADFSITVENFIDTKYFNRIDEIKESDLTAWHIFVSNKVNNKDAEIVKSVFDSLKADKQFTKSIEDKFQIQKFSEAKDQAWLKVQFNKYKTVIETLPKATAN